jgi:hypothetical protein
MMDKILDIVPYTGEHGIYIMKQQMNHPLMDKDMEFEGNAKNLEQDKLAFTGLVNGKPVFAAGMKILWNGVAEGWVIATNEVWNHPLLIAKAIKKDFARIAKKNNINRVQTAVRANYTTGLRFAKWLGLQEEGLMKKFGFDGSDQYMYARLF